MIRRSALVFGVLLLAALGGCSGGEVHRPAAENTAGYPRGDNNATVSQANSAVHQAPTASDDPAPEMSPAEPLAAVNRNTKFDVIRRSAANAAGPKIDIEVLLKDSTRPAPENSLFAAVLTDVVFERRTFIKHPILVKVEKVTDGERSTIKVFTTDGRMVEMPGKVIEKLSVASSASILRAAGIDVPRPRTAERKSGAENTN